MASKQYTHDEIRALLAARTPGQWSVEDTWGAGAVHTDSQDYGICYDMMSDDDAALVAAAPDIIQQLLRELGNE